MRPQRRGWLLPHSKIWCSLFMLKRASWGQIIPRLRASTEWAAAYPELDIRDSISTLMDVRAAGRSRCYGGERAYVGVIAQEVQTLVPDAVSRGWDGYLRVFYDKVGLKFQTYDQWIASGARVPP
jgi:hypothetical protein